ncbi:hypothetical protein HK405_015626, partial [Cladochytrium tenue]
DAAAATIAPSLPVPPPLFGADDVADLHAEDPVRFSDHLLRGAGVYGPRRIEYAFAAHDRDARVLLNVVSVGDRICGHRNIVHGGLIAALFDDFTGALFMLRAAGRYTGFTANLTVDYRTPLPAPSTFTVVVWIERVDGRKIVLRAEIRSVHPAVATDVADDAVFVIPAALGDGPAAADARSADAAGPPSVGARWAGADSTLYAECKALYIVPRQYYDAVIARGDVL